MVVTPNEWMMATVALALAALRLVRAPVAERMPLVRWSMVFLLALFALDNIMRIHWRWLWARARAEWREWRRGWILPR